MIAEKLQIASIGFGNRARKYIKYILEHSSTAQLCAIVESNEERLSQAKESCNLSSDNYFNSLDQLIESFLSNKIKLDAAIIATNDSTHYSIAKKLMSKGIHILLEKPMSQTAQQCNSLVKLAQEKQLVTSLCYIMRFHPYYRRIKEICQSLDLCNSAKIETIYYKVYVGINRMTHTFVRGLWSKEKESAPIFTSKCCHDVDFLLWLTNTSCAKEIKIVSSDKKLSFYTEKNAPKDATTRCVICPIEKECKYSAVELYKRKKDWISNFIPTKDESIDEYINRELSNGCFGRCVFHCDNDVADIQTVKLKIRDIDVTIELDGVSDKDGREITIIHKDGKIIAKDYKIQIINNDNSSETVEEDFKEISKQPYHAGADFLLVEDFIKTIRDNNNLGQSKTINQCELIQRTKTQRKLIQRAKTQCELKDALLSNLICFYINNLHS